MLNVWSLSLLWRLSKTDTEHVWGFCISHAPYGESLGLAFFWVLFFYVSYCCLCLFSNLVWTATPNSGITCWLLSPVFVSLALDLMHLWVWPTALLLLFSFSHFLFSSESWALSLMITFKTPSHIYILKCFISQVQSNCLFQLFFFLSPISHTFSDFSA